MKKSGWTSAFETGISALDMDHQTLLGLINRVIAASEGSNQAGLKSSLLDLHDEMIAHFEREEQLMAECMYAAADQHQEEHQQLSDEIQDQIKDLDAGKANVSFIARFMRNWLIQHIVTKDAHFGNAVLAQDGTTDRRQTRADDIDIFGERRLGNLESIHWSPTLALGVEAIDANHHAMIDLLNAILLVRNTDDKTVLASLLQQFGNQTVLDFQIEEGFMLKLSVEDARKHREEHQKLLEEFANQVDDWRENRISAELLSRFMYRWLIRHIDALDVPLGQAIIQQKQSANAGSNSPKPAT